METAFHKKNYLTSSNLSSRVTMETKNVKRNNKVMVLDYTSVRKSVRVLVVNSEWNLKLERDVYLQPECVSIEFRWMQQRTETELYTIVL